MGEARGPPQERQTTPPCGGKGGGAPLPDGRGTGGLVLPYDRGEIWDFLEGIDDAGEFLAIMNTDLDATFEDALVRRDGELMDVDVHLISNDESDITGDALTVDTLDDDDGIEEHFLIVHIPAHGKDAMREGVAKTISHLT